MKRKPGPAPTVVDPVTVSTVLPRTLVDRLDTVANTLGVTRSNFLRELIDDALDRLTSSDG